MVPTVITSPPGGAVSRPMLSLLGGFSLRVGGQDVAVPMHAKRVLAYLSLDSVVEPDCDRGVLAERLWPDSPEDRCRAGLRTALWRIRQATPDLVDGRTDRVGLADRVVVDVHGFRDRAQQILADRPTDAPAMLAEARELACAAELLPGWDEVWLLLAREQLRQLRLHAMETVARRLNEQGRTAEAIDMMLILVAEEPLRESAQSALIEAHLGEGNVCEARRQLTSYATLLWTELSLRPSPELIEKVGIEPPFTGAPWPAPPRRRQ